MIPHSNYYCQGVLGTIAKITLLKNYFMQKFILRITVGYSGHFLRRATSSLLFILLLNSACPALHMIAFIIDITIIIDLFFELCYNCYMNRNVRYFYDSTQRVEIILCENSNITYPLHNHVSVITIGIVLSGSISLTTKQGTAIYKTNQIFAVHPYEPHSISTDNHYTLLTICIDKNIIHSTPMISIKNDIASALSAAFRNSSIDRKYSIQVLNQMSAIAALISPTEFNESLVTEFTKQLELSPECKTSIQDMAHATFLSKYHFIRRFKAEVGLTPHQFQIQNRVRKAQRLLNSTRTLTDVALSAGFYDQSHFTKQFEKYVGLTPLSYKSAIVTFPNKID